MEQSPSETDTSLTSQEVHPFCCTQILNTVR